MKLSIVIVNWNAGDQLKACIESIWRSAIFLQDDWEVIIIDNASSDDSLAEITQTCLHIRLIKNQTNRGFAAACNQGAAIANGCYLLFLNPDTILFPDSLVKPLLFMEEQSSQRIGICGIRLINADGYTSTCASRFPSLRNMIGTLLGLSSWVPQIFPSHLMHRTELESSRFVDQVTGAYFLLRREVFDACSGFDERYFVYYEEVDFSLRALEKGYKSYFLADVTAFHQGGGCSQQVKAARLFYGLRSRIQYARKHFSSPSRAGLWILMTVEFPARLTRAIVHLSLDEIVYTLMAYVMLAKYGLSRK